ncbi:tetratricopeptide repeat protein [Pseudalkalibacillus berkeleyi]|uniref:Tetratricopeptide repeat protein n=1 Tax=Pseudalkalibacillus berkeleyi TaxID=1069813 RepID=A0ABS9H121_9BACL|nr:tetratricopeptide repeat protein [Pseudalkalibacillus berkeleyi]MCF6137776.1 tetratricopeptide repeat protein [Pseudalkalibacillus berkeleyi]
MQDYIQLINDQKFREANVLLLKLVEESPNDPVINFYCAVTYDALGMERKAIQFYKAALTSEINGPLRERTYVQLGSSYRCVGEYQKCRNILEEGMMEYPHNLAMKVFHSMVMYNLNENEESMTSLLSILVSTTSDPWIAKYSKALEFYSDKLDQTW